MRMLDKSQYKVNGDKLLFANQTLLKAKGSIENFFILDDVIVILVDGSSLDSDRNIFGFDISGNVKWQIPEPDHLHERNYYTFMYVSESNELQAYSQSGVEVTINKENGNILKKELIK